MSQWKSLPTPTVDPAAFEVLRVWITPKQGQTEEYHVSLRIFPGDDNEPYGHLLFDCAWYLAESLSSRLSADFEQVLSQIVDVLTLQLTDDDDSGVS